MVLHPFILTDSSGAQKMVSSILSVCDCSDFPDGLGETRNRVDFRFRGEIIGEAGDISGDERLLERRANLLFGGALAAMNST